MATKKNNIVTLDQAKATANAEKTRRLNQSKAHTKATESQWEMCKWAIDAFMAKYPVHWSQFQAEVESERNMFNKHNVALEGDLKKAGFRLSATFPVILGAEGQEIDALLPVLQKIIPGLVHKDSANFNEFLKRFPQFRTTYEKR